MKAIAFSEHGNIFNWILKKQDCDKAGIKYIHGVETYLCRNLSDNDRGAHICLYAKNLEGVFELNKLVSISTSKGVLEDNSDRHMYFNPRISLVELMNTSDNIIVTTACLASPLQRWSEDDLIISYRDQLIEWMTNNKHRCFLEVQYHNCDSQIQYNKALNDLSVRTGIALIAGTDTHSSTSYKAECRKILQKSKSSFYGEEDEFDLTWKTYDQLVECFENQNALPKEIYMKAIQNTNTLAEMIDDFDLDRSFKYPDLYGDTAREQWQLLIKNKLKEKIDNQIIDVNRVEEYRKRILYEFDEMSKLGMESFMLFMSELMTWCVENGIAFGTGRGSVAGSVIAYITDITDVDPIVWNTVFSRFVNSDRISLGDIDCDFAPEDRAKVYEYIISKFTSEKTAYIVTFSTLKDRGCIDVLSKGLDYKNLDKVMDIKNQFEDSLKAYSKIIQEEVNLEELVENGDIESSSIDFDNHKIYETRINNETARVNASKLKEKRDRLIEDNADIFYYFKGLKNTIIAKGVHPSGMIGSPITLMDNMGLFYKDGDEQYPTSSCNMKAVDSLNYVKFDILGLKTVGIIKDVCAFIGIPYPKSHNINWNDERVWDNMVLSKQGVFQFEGDYAFELLKTFKPRTINHMSMVNAALRPSGKSYRDKLIAGEILENPSKEIDDLLKENNGFLIFQEDTIKFLTDICGFSGNMADTTRRCIDENSLILMANGNRKKIKDVNIGDHVVSINKNNSIESSVVKEKYYNGIQNTYKIWTQHYNTLLATANHKVLTQDGWKEVRDISCNDWLMTPVALHSLSDEQRISKNPEYMPVKVINVEEFGECNVYDLEIENNHNYVANEIIVHNCIGKKDKENLQKQLPLILEGYCNKSSKPREIAEQEAMQFLKIIQDSSEYQFGYNHSTAYSMNGYECTYLRTYYPLEFTTAYLNRAENTDDINNGVELAKLFNISINPIQFGKSLAEYTMEKSTNSIYKGIASIKFCNAQIASELMEISKNTYHSFIDVIHAVKTQTSVDARQLSILTGLNFFSQFGKNKYLLQMIDIYDNFHNVQKQPIKQIKIAELEKYGLTEYLMEKYSQKQTKALYKELDVYGIIKELCNKLENKSMGVIDQIKFEMTYITYCTYVNPNVSDKYYIVIEFKCYQDTTKPYILLRNLKTGHEIKSKVKSGKKFKLNPFGCFSVLEVIGLNEQFKKRKIGDDWVVLDETEFILDEWSVVKQ